MGSEMCIRDRPVDERAGCNSYHGGSGLYFILQLLEDGTLKLLCPERANNRRMFRKFGSHRFLHVNVGLNVPVETRINFFLKQHAICGRIYRCLWCKMTKMPQSFVLFAEKGVGISLEDEMTTEQVSEWCIPATLNGEMTLGKKLNA